MTLKIFYSWYSTTLQALLGKTEKTVMRFSRVLYNLVATEFAKCGWILQNRKILGKVVIFIMEYQLFNWFSRKSSQKYSSLSFHFSMFFFLKLEKLKTLEKVDIFPRFHPDFLVGQILIEKNDPSLLVDGAKSDQHRLYTPTKAKNRPKNFGSVPPHPGNYYQAKKWLFLQITKVNCPPPLGVELP